jgi:hypothetical protein
VQSQQISGYNVGDVFEAGVAQGFDSNSRPRTRVTDSPLRPGILLRYEAVSDAALSYSIPGKIRDASLCILGNLLSLLAEQQFVFYARDNNHYAGIGRYAPNFYRRKHIVAAIGYLTSGGLIEDLPTRPSPSAWFRSRARATERFVAYGASLPASAVMFQPPELLVLRGENGKPLRYEDCDVLRAARAEIAAHNEYLATVDVTVNHESAFYDERGYLLAGQSKINPFRRAYYRVLNKSIFWGGRYYGPWWQSLPVGIRSGILINGEQTIEEDYRCCHLHLLFAACGETLGKRDPYAEVGLPRADVKQAIQTMLNASCASIAVRALSLDLDKTHGACQKLMRSIQEAFPRLTPYWNTGCGLRLQNIDARMCTRVQRRLRQAGVPALSIHDSFIVQAKSAKLLRTVMAEELAAACEQLRHAGIDPPHKMTVADF